MKRTLSLKAEALTELTSGELSGVVGGNTPDCASRGCPTGLTCFLTQGLCDPQIQITIEGCL